MKRRSAALWALGLMMAAAPVAAEQVHGAHEHGVAELRVAIDGGAIELEFASPLDSLVGFEHAPRTAAQRKAFTAAEAVLRDPAQVFALPAGAGCEPKDVTLASPWSQRAADGRAPEPGAADDGDPGHAELVARYRLECARPAALDVLQIRLFPAFPRLREIRAERVSPRGQAATRLTPRQASLAL